MATPETKLRITEETNDALKKVAARFPEWSLAQLGNKLLLESCQTIMSESTAVFPTVSYLRQQLGSESGSASSLPDLVERLERAAEKFNASAGPAKKDQAARKKAA